MKVSVMTLGGNQAQFLRGHVKVDARIYTINLCTSTVVTQTKINNKTCVAASELRLLRRACGNIHDQIHQLRIQLPAGAFLSVAMVDAIDSVSKVSMVLPR